MKRIFPIILASLLAMTVCAASAQEADGGPRNGDLQVTVPLLAAHAAAERGQPDIVLMSLQTAMRDDVFAQLSEPKRYEVAELYSVAAYQLGRWEETRLGAARAADSPLATEDDWSLRLAASVYLGQGAEADLAFKHLADRGTAALEAVGGRQIYRLDGLLRDLPNAGSAHLLLGREMERENWEQAYVFDDPSIVWLHYAEALLEAGDLAKAKAIIKRVTDPVAIMAMKADRRFDSITEPLSPSQAATVAAESYLASAQTYVRDNPRMLSGRIAVVRALAILNKPQEALDVINDADVAIAHASASEPAFDDMDVVDVFEGWKSAILDRVGRRDEGIGALTATASCHCSGLAVLQLARTQLEAGRPQEAQRWLDGMGEGRLGPEERMTLAQLQTCVAAQRTDAQGVAKGLEFLAAHESWKPAAKIEAMICANQLDAAASALTAQLADPRTRLAALGALQAYAPKAHASPYDEILRARWSKLVAMPNVQAQVAKVGRINRYDLTAQDVIG